MKEKAYVILLQLVFCLLFFKHVNFVGIADTLTDIVVSQGESIQAAINKALYGQKILVKNGTYYEKVFVNKSVSLLGENVYGVTIDGNGGNSVVNILADNVVFQCFTVRNASVNNGYTIQIYNSKNVTVKNCRLDTGFYGIEFTNSMYSRVLNNEICLHYAGIYLHGGSKENVLIGNSLFNNSFGIVLSSSTQNSIFHNNFFNNSNSYWTDGSANYWYKNYPSGGNYWSDYQGVDDYRGPEQKINGPDGLGDKPYYDLDIFPFIYPIKTMFYGDSNYYFLISSNLELLQIDFRPENASVSYVVKGDFGKQCYCRVLIPRRLIWVSSLSEWSIMVGNQTVPSSIDEGSDWYYFYFTFYSDKSCEIVTIKGTYGVSELNLSWLFYVFLILLSLFVAILLVLLKAFLKNLRIKTSRTIKASKSK
jgi:parallel beta-helix repeat protein